MRAIVARACRQTDVAAARRLLQDLARRLEDRYPSAAAVLEAVKGFRQLKGHRDMPKLVAALRARDRQLGIPLSVEDVA